MSRISIVVPIYNAGKRLEKCIKSILNQTFSDFELILVNDGSTDHSLAICQRFQQQDKRIIIIDKKNEGSIATRRRGVEAASSEYIMFVDADDWIDKHTIEILNNESLERSIDIVVCNTYRVLGFIKQKNNSEYFSADKIYNKEQIRKYLVIAYFQGDPFPSSLFAKLYKRELFMNSGKYLDKIYFFGDDLFLNMEIFLKANQVKVIDKSLYFYTLSGNTSRYMPHFFNDVFSGYQIQKEVIAEHYQDIQQHQYNGISVMLLNLFRGALYNLFTSKLSEDDIKNLIKIYVSDDCVKEAVSNEGAIKFFEKDYLDAMREKDIQYLYAMGKSMHKKKKPKKMLMNIMSRLSIS
ncbi:glycosyltransferase [Paenibacillus sp. LMG 31456]|uniref:Glycosyltransferase n=1 Tax=Paenibacillus foliorum TaxID=2654974 RepID=A0A972GZC0_9BACL|nr:glycosyltransferase [Paenibacillus foliorum]NOU97334.1 glycosyltransferase [Paenibacillus foliorum]